MTAVAASSTTAAPATPAPAKLAAPTPALEARLSVPVGLAFDPTGNLYVSQCPGTSSMIDRIDRHGQLTRFAGAGPSGFAGDGGHATSAALDCPLGMAFGPDGALYVADHANNRIRRIDVSGIITTVAGSGPTGVNEGSFSGDGGPAVNATLQEPVDVAVDEGGNLFIADRDNNRVRKVEPSGVITTIAGDGQGRFAGDGGPAAEASVFQPQGVAVDAAGNLLIADAGNERVRRVDLEGMISTYLGTGTQGATGDGGPATEATIDLPNDLAFDAGRALLVSTGNRIRRVDSTGEVSTIAGGGTGQLVDGIRAARGRFGEIDGLAVDGAGNIYLADGFGGVDRIDAKGILTRFAGRRV